MFGNRAVTSLQLALIVAGASWTSGGRAQGRVEREGYSSGEETVLDSKGGFTWSLFGPPVEGSRKFENTSQCLDAWVPSSLEFISRLGTTTVTCSQEKVTRRLVFLGSLIGTVR